MNRVLNVVELFAGVSGFRLGLEKTDANFSIQLEQTSGSIKKVQHAFDCYSIHFKKESR